MVVQYLEQEGPQALLSVNDESLFRTLLRVMSQVHSLLCNTGNHCFHKIAIVPIVGCSNQVAVNNNILFKIKFHLHL